MAFDDDVAATGTVTVSAPNFNPFAAAAAVDVAIAWTRRRRNANGTDSPVPPISVGDDRVAVRTANPNDPAIISDVMPASRAMAMSMSYDDISCAIPVVAAARTAMVTTVDHDNVRRRRSLFVVMKRNGAFLASQEIQAANGRDGFDP